MRTIWFIFIIVETLQAGNPFLSLPGVRARALGGAYVAIANDASSVWYNPAGIASIDRDLILEWTRVPGNDDLATTIPFRNLPTREPGIGPDTRIPGSAERDAIFLSYRHKFTEGFGFGLFYSRPYSFDIANFDSGSVSGENRVFGQLHETLEVAGIAPAWATPGKLFQIGFTVEYVRIDYSDSLLFPVDNRGGVATGRALLIGEEAEVDGFSGSLGILWTIPLQRRSGSEANLKIGGVYRSPSETELKEVPEIPRLERTLFAKPSGADLGLALEKSFTRLRSVITISGQYTQSEFDSISGDPILAYRTYSVGLEYQLSLSDAYALIPRTGRYSGKPTSGLGPDISAESWGLEFLLGGIFTLSLTYESRTLSDPLQELEFDLFSASTNFIF